MSELSWKRVRQGEGINRSRNQASNRHGGICIREMEKVPFHRGVGPE